ncbi:MAG: NRDE family protein [Nocardiopsaceae bacterium]|nr:NRDE family protein [Nocardiopsaceae bacterium]
MCTVVLRLSPGEPVPLLLLGVRDEFIDRAWRPPARHWAGSPLIGGMDEQAGGTWLAVHPGELRVACLLNGRGGPAAPETRRSRGELPLRAATGGSGSLKDLADDPGALVAYDPFHLVCADAAGATLLSWDGAAALADLPPGTHLLTNVGHSYPVPGPVAGQVAGPPAGAVGEPDPWAKAAYFGPKFAASADPSRWRALADGDGLPPDDPRAIVARRALPDGRTWGTTSQTLVALVPGEAGEGRVRYDFRPVPGEWYQVPIRR